MTSKKTRQYFGLAAAIIMYFIIHEGAHWLVAVIQGVFRQINVIGLGIQIDVFREQMTDTQLGVFCIAGAVSTFIMAHLFVAARKWCCNHMNDLGKATIYYITLVLLFCDPAYLSIVYRFVGGGDMNGIALLIPEITAQIIFGILFLLNLLTFWKVVLPTYSEAFKK